MTNFHHRTNVVIDSYNGRQKIIALNMNTCNER